MPKNTPAKPRSRPYPLRWHLFSLSHGGLVLVALALAFLADFLFFRQWVGWTLGGFFAAVLGLMLIRHGNTLSRRTTAIHGWLCAALMLGLIAAMVIEPSTLAFLLALVALASLALIARGGWPTGGAGGLGWRWLSRVGWVWLAVWAQPILDCKLARRWKRRIKVNLVDKAIAAGKLAGKLIWTLAGIVIPIAIGMLFVGLFSIANPVIAKWMGNRFSDLSDFMVNVTDHLTIGRMFLWIVAGIGGWGLMRFRYRPMRRVDPQSVPLYDPSYLANQNPWGSTSIGETPQEKQAALTPPTAAQEAIPTTAAPPSEEPAAAKWVAQQIARLAVKTLVVLNGIFLVQLVLDGRYLFLGSALPEGMTYAHYAHRGAYPLVVTALLAGALVLAVFRPGGAAERSDWARGLVLLWIVQNVVLMLTAAWRLWLYVEVYSLTRLRFAAAIWMLMVAGGLLLLLWRIARRRDNAWLTGWTMGWGLIVLYICCFVPFDPIIAGFNVTRCKEMGGPGGSVDVAYLEHLGPDALPAIDRLLEEVPVEIADRPADYVPDSFLINSRGYTPVSGSQRGDAHIPTLHEELTAVRAALAKELESRLSGWRGWTVRRAWLAGQVE